MHTLFAATFDDPHAADAAVRELRAARFDPAREVAVIVRCDAIRDEGELHTTVAGDVGSPPLLALGDVTALVAPLGVTPGAVVATGPAIAAIQGAFVSTPTDPLTGAVFGLGLSDDEAVAHVERIHAGDVWLAVATVAERAADARAILFDAGVDELIERIPDDLVGPAPGAG